MTRADIDRVIERLRTKGWRPNGLWEQASLDEPSDITKATSPLCLINTLGCLDVDWRANSSLMKQEAGLDNYEWLTDWNDRQESVEPVIAMLERVKARLDQ